MHFKRMEIHGFKSFAEPTVIEFDRGITCVVGPNGSGKSNICDAVRWVLGAQSAKVLRGDKMEDVIFAGSSGRRSRGMAEVTLVIDNSDSALEIDYDEVAITRRMYRSGESEYLINNTPCRMRDIRELIMDTGIGVEGYSIIGQGKISDIISNNTESIREILEETAGIVMYRSRKAEAERKLTAATGNLERVGDIIGEIEGRIPGLKEDSEKATVFLELRDRYKELEINITLNNIDNIKKKNEIVEEDLKEIQKQIAESSVARENIIEKLNAERLKSGKLDEALEEARREKEDFSTELNRLTGREVLDRQRLISIERDGERLNREIREIDTKIKTELDNAKGLYSQREDWEKKYDEIKEVLEAKLEEYQQLQTDLDKMNQAVDEKKNGIFEVQNKISQKQAEASSIESLQETLKRRKESILNQREDTGKEGVYTEKDLNKVKYVKANLEEEVKNLNKKREELGQNREKNLSESLKIASKIEEMRISMGELSSRKKTFEEMESNYEGYNKAVKYIMKSDAKGLSGVVAELIKVPSGFEVAMETAFGQAMQNIVCEKDSDAKAAVEKLKESRSGRLTFLPMQSVKSRGVKTDSACEASSGFKGYAVDCIEFKDKYRNVMEYLIGNVVVMDNMDNAIKLSKKVKGGYKIVTLEGELISQGGSITGGRYRNKSANFLERKAEISQLENRLKDMNEELSAKEKKSEELKTLCDEASSKINEIREDIISKERDIFAKDNEINIINTAIIDFASVNQRWEDELAEIEKEESNISRLSEGLNREIAELKEQIATLEEDVSAETLNLETQKENLEKQNEEVTRERISLGSLDSEKSRVEAIIKRVEDSIEAYERDKQVKSEELLSLSKEREEIKDVTAKNTETIEEKEKQIQELNSKLDEMTAERRRLNEEFDENSVIKEEMDRELLSLSNQKNEMDIRKTRQDTQLENARNKLWEEFEISYAQAIDYRSDNFVISAAIKENREIKGKLRELGEVNISAIEEYKQVSERYDFLTEQKEDIEKSMDELDKIVTDMDKIIKARFKDSFDSVVENFEVVFRELYGGGHAKITLADESRPFDSEIEITAQPPGKQLKHINLLSGGEKTMTAIALMFAVLKTKPTPCCILDEVEAALDDSNLQIFGRYLRAFEGVQFTLITHQKATMEHADIMYGITMPEGGVSKVYSLKLEDKAGKM